MEEQVDGKQEVYYEQSEDVDRGRVAWEEDVMKTQLLESNQSDAKEVLVLLNEGLECDEGELVYNVLGHLLDSVEQLGYGRRMG